MRKILFLGWVILFVFLTLPLTHMNTESKTTVSTIPVYTTEMSSNTHQPLDPATNYETFGGSLIQEIYEGLLRYNGNSYSSYSPALAYTNYTISPDGLNYTFYLRSGVNFTDGSPFNAYVMQYSIQRAIIMNDPASGAWIPQSVIRDGPRIMNLQNENIIQANQFLSNRSVVAQSDTILSIALEKTSSAFIPSIIYLTCDAVSPSAVITHEPNSYSTNQSDLTYGMISLNDMFPNLDNTTIKEKLGLSPNADLNNSGIVPNSAVGSLSDYNWDAQVMPGTGPYMLENDTSGVETVLVKNNNWWNKDNFNPQSPDIVQIKQVSVTSSRILDLVSGVTLSATIPNSDLNQVLNTSTKQPFYENLNVYTFPSLSEFFMQFNQNASLPTAYVYQNSWSKTNQYNVSYIKSHNLVQYSWLNNSGGVQYASPDNPFTSLLFRKAFAYAFDYTTFIQNNTNNIDFRMQGVIPKDLLGHQDDLISEGYIPNQNLSLAKTLFQEVSWQGYLVIHYTTGLIFSEQAAQLLKDTITSLNVGITLSIENPTPTCQAFMCFYSNPGLFFNGWNPDYADARDYAIPFLHTNGVLAFSMHYSNPYVDSLINKADISTNATLRNQLYREMEINASQDYPFIYLNQANKVIIQSKMITGIDNSSTGSFNSLNYGPQYQYIGLDPSLVTTSYTTTINPTSSSTSLIITTSHQTISNPLTYSQTQPQTNINSTAGFNIGKYIQPTITAGLLITIPSVILGISYEYRKATLKAKTAGIKNYSFRDFVNKKKVTKVTLSDDTLDKLQDIIEENSK